MKEAIIRLLLGGAGRLMAVILGGLRDRAVFDKMLILAELYIPAVAGSNPDAAGEEKRKLVREVLLRDLKSIGKELPSYLLNLAIELAYAYLALRAPTKIGRPTP